MAYADINQLRPTPKGLVGAVFINGLLLVGIAFIAPNVMKEGPQKGTTLIDIFTPPPPPIIKDTPPPPRPAKADSAVTEKPPEARVQASSGSGIETSFTVPILPSFPPGEASAIIEPPQPLIAEPVFKAAKLNPRYASALQPEYPPGMIRQEKEGAVTIKILIGTDGRVKQVDPVRFEEDAFLIATRRQALSSWRFLPATKDGEPVESWKEMTVRFQMPS
jgi:periplasmic protein TonB